MSPALLALLLLTFLQLITGFFEATYAFGLLSVDIPPEIASVLLLFSPALLMVFPRVLRPRNQRRFLLATGLLALLCRALSLVLDTRGKMITCGLGVGLFLLFLVALLREESHAKTRTEQRFREREEEKDIETPVNIVERWGAGLALAALIAIFLHAAGLGNDLSSFPRFAWIGILLVLAAGALLLRWNARRPAQPRDAEDDRGGNIVATRSRDGNGISGAVSNDRLGSAILASLGLFSPLVLLYFGFAAPGVLARWTGFPYPAAVILAAASALAVLWSRWAQPGRLRAPSPTILTLWRLAFLLALAGAMRLSATTFPGDPAAYPLDAAGPSPLAWVALVLALALHPVIYYDFGRSAARLGVSEIAPRRLALAVLAGAVYLLLMAFAQVFTTVYDYIPVIGPLFRNQGWLVMAVPALVGVLVALYKEKINHGDTEDTERSGRRGEAFEEKINHGDTEGTERSGRIGKTFEEKINHGGTENTEESGRGEKGYSAKMAQRKDSEAPQSSAFPPSPRQTKRGKGVRFFPALLAVASAVLSLLPGLRLGMMQWGEAPLVHRLRVLTYNIQQGYTQDGQKDFAAQLALIRSLQPDVIGLQETDMARVANGNSDEVRYLAFQLGMHAYYGPRPVDGTFGVALLTRFPVEDARVFYMYSEGEQTAAIQAEMAAGGQTFHILVTHLGNGGPLIQQQQIIERLEGQENVIAMGDFNFRPDTEQYALTTTSGATTGVLADGWLLAGDRRTAPPDLSIDVLDPGRRIDHIFLSPGLRALEAVYLDRGPSDHPAMFVEVRW